jgi:hypothetical protein
MKTLNATQRTLFASAALMCTVMFVQGVPAVYRSFVNQHCLDGDKASCKIAATWGYKPTPINGRVYDRASCQAAGGTWVGNHPGVCVPG